jgi:hypothetical protein
MSVGDAIALAGGIVPDGNSGRVELIRDGETIAGNLGGGTRLADTPIRSGDQLNVPYKSWLSRNGYLAGGLLSAVGAIVALTVPGATPPRPTTVRSPRAEKEPALESPTGAHRRGSRSGIRKRRGSWGSTAVAAGSS